MSNCDRMKQFGQRLIRVCCLFLLIGGSLTTSIWAQPEVAAGCPPPEENPLVQARMRELAERLALINDHFSQDAEGSQLQPLLDRLSYLEDDAQALLRQAESQSDRKIERALHNLSGDLQQMSVQIRTQIRKTQPAQAMQQRAGTASISGFVYQSNGYTPINLTGGSAFVHAYTSPCGSSSVGYGVVNSTTGAYTISNLEAGTYYLQTDVYNVNYLDEWWASPNSTLTCTNAQPITVMDGGTASGRNFQLDTGAQISGTVYQSNGYTPVNLTGGSAFVYAYTSACIYSPVGYGSVNSTTGAYTIVGLPTGTYYLYASVSDVNYVEEYWASPTSTLDCRGAQPVTVTAGGTATGRNFQLDTGAQISGTVYQSNGYTPVSFTDGSIEVSAYNLSFCGRYSPAGYDLVDGTTGAYTIMGLPAGTYYLQTHGDNVNYRDEYWASPYSVLDSGSKQMFAVTASETVTGKNFQLDAGGQIIGTVYQSDGTPINLNGGSLYVYAYTGDPCGSSFVSSDSVDGTTGAYTIKGLPAGTYYLRTRSDDVNYIREWWALPNSTPSCGSAQSMVLGDGGSITDRNFRLDTGAQISGTVSQSNGSPPVNSTGGDIEVEVYTGNPCGSPSYVGYGSVNATGAYTVKGLSTGRYYLRTRSDGVNYLNEWWALPYSTSSCSGAQSVYVVAGGSITDRNFQLDTGAQISGTVYQSDGITPVDFTCGYGYVYLYTGSCGSLTSVSEDYVNQITGAYSLMGLPAGTYYLKASVYETLIPYQTEWWASPASTTTCSSAQMVAVTAGGNVTGMNFQLDELQLHFLLWTK